MSAIKVLAACVHGVHKAIIDQPTMQPHCSQCGAPVRLLPIPAARVVPTPLVPTPQTGDAASDVATAAQAAVESIGAAVDVAQAIEDLWQRPLSGPL